MATKGRKRKAGKRTKSGQLARTYDKGSDHTQAMQALYGQDGCDAIGRVFRSGLLGEGSEAKAMLDMARAISNAYWAAYAVGPITCTLGDKHGATPIDSARAARREQWLNDTLLTVRSYGERYRRPFYQLVIEVNPDHGPLWADRLCFAQRSKTMEPEPTDSQSMDAAIHILRALIA